MKYNKSEIMSLAWNLYYTKRYRTFSRALCVAWSIAKKIVVDRANGRETFSDIRVGDTITFEYGDYGNWVTCRVRTIAESKMNVGCQLIIADSIHGSLEVEICVKPYDTVRRIAEAKSAAA